ncbi:hypothetical protein KK009_03395 [Enterobacter hormaechei subsp. hoffmannii]|nr:hypothetical protein [Enterobacter hormaechei subsp. hoffmannii]MBT1990004.1 hypothetical protein [Enterobacter hormaechei subsp. hoffmannii]MBT2111985.1 hypothetical protein [Enterobacter hormaechei subsp. hoffmannii]MBT2120552.1 hypothetical protein [Enterobacter hormaechei subsp. hoffmannii]
MRPLMPPVQTPDNLFHDGNPLTGELGTIVDAEHLNNVQGAVRDAQSELITVLTAAGINVDPSKQNQLLTALKALLLSRSTPFADIKSDGAAAIATALSNLGLKEAAKRDVGVGAGQIPDMSSFTASRATTGWQKLPGGLIIQWGQAATNTSSLVTVAYPIPFPNNVFQVIGSCLDVNNADIVAINSTDGVNFNLVAWVATSGSVLRTTTPVKWIAIGN